MAIPMMNWQERPQSNGINAVGGAMQGLGANLQTQNAMNAIKPGGKSLDDSFNPPDQGGLTTLPNPIDPTTGQNLTRNPDSNPYGGFLGNIGQGISNALGLGLSNIGSAALIPGLATAAQQYNQANDYTRMAEGYANRLDPFGSQRGQYQNLLSQSYSNPQQFLNSPIYQQQLQHGLDSVARTGASQGYLGSGNMETALQDYAHTSDQDFLNQTRNSLMPLTGAQFGPASAAQILQTGMLGRMGAQNNALGAMFAPFGMNTPSNQNGGGMYGQGTSAAQAAARYFGNGNGGGSGGIPSTSTGNLGGSMGMTPGGLATSDNNPWPGYGNTAGNGSVDPSTFNSNGTTPWITGGYNNPGGYGSQIDPSWLDNSTNMDNYFQFGGP